MKQFSTLIAILSSLFLYSQDKTLSRSELDSLNTKENTHRVEFFKTNTLSGSKSNETPPLYKGCKKRASNADKMKCLSEKIANHFNDNFNTEMHEESDLEPGEKRILLSFKIDLDGKLIDIIAEAEEEYLEAEAIRVIKLIPELKPGTIDGKPVVVPYKLPLIVYIVPNKDEGKTRYPIYRGCDESLSNKELEACSKEKITNFIRMSYDIELASRALPLEKSTQFLLEFIIDEKGKIKDINAKANHKAIAIEAINVAQRLPKFKKPGIWEGVAVETPYKLLMTLYFN